MNTGRESSEGRRQLLSPPKSSGIKGMQEVEMCEEKER